MIDAYERSAERLLDASAEDRAWVLAQLLPDDCIRILAKMRDMVESSVDAERDAIHSGMETAGHYVPPVHERYPRLAKATVSEVAKMLDGEPDWMISLLVQEARWPWVEGFLSSLDPIRLEKIEGCVRLGRTTIKSAVLEQLFTLTNEKLAKPENAAIVPTAFEDILTRLRTKVSEGVPPTAPLTQ